MDYVLEVCVDTVESAIEAAAGGATRLELCGDLIIGGVTPDTALFERVREVTDVPIRVMIRPRFGDFLYSTEDFELMRRQVIRYCELGAEGVVIGVLKPDGTLDEERMKELINLAGSMGVTLHRAFDLTRDPMEALETARKLGIDTILTSGQKNTCLEGASLLAELVAASHDLPRILIGSGVTASAIRTLGPITGSRAFHLSGKKTVESGMIFRREEVRMGLPGFSEYQNNQTDRNKVADALRELKALL